LKAELIVNPCSGGFNKGKLDNVVNILRDKIQSISIIYTGYAKPAEKLASASQADVLFIAGGDGLINEAINGIINKNCIIYQLPFGTANVFCREYNIPVNPLVAAKRFDFDDIYKIPLGRINNRIFVKMVVFGYDSVVVNNLNYYLRKINSKLAHVVSGIKVLLNNNFKPFNIYINDNEIKAYTSIISLGRKYAGKYNLVKHFFFDGFTICVIKQPGRIAILKNFISILCNKGVMGDVYLYNKLQVNGVPYCQIDGEYFGLTNNRCDITIMKSSFYLASSRKDN
jgi:diacylglycerol kinase family enzyme